MPSPASIAKVRAFAAQTLELNRYMRSPEVVRERLLTYGLPTPAEQRAATEAEILKVAADLDAGLPINPRLWGEAMRMEPLEAVSLAKALRVDAALRAA